MSAVADVRGLKRICGDCGVRFYDLNKRPIICPSCGTEFDGEIKVKARRGRSAAVPEDTAIKPAEAEAAKAKSQVEDDDDELEEEDDGAEIVSLDDDAVVSGGAVSDDDDDVKHDLDKSGDSDDDDDDLPDLEDDLVSLDDLESEDEEDDEEEAS